MFLSFIVPVYNTEQYLDECLSSLLNQDIPMDDYEIICINDGSTDNSLSVIQAYERNYSNVYVINKGNVWCCRRRAGGKQMSAGHLHFNGFES